MSTTNILITGVSGLLGINLALEAMHEHEVIGIDRGKLKSAPFRVLKETNRALGRQCETLRDLADG